MWAFNRTFGSSFLLFNLLLLGSGQHQMLYQYLFTTPTETVRGEILESKFVRSPSRIGSTKGDYVLYKYTVDGAEYTSERVNYSVSGSDAERIVNQYEVGNNVLVYYDKKRPEYSILEPVGKPLGLLFNVIGANFFALILGMSFVDLWGK